MTDAKTIDQFLIDFFRMIDPDHKVPDEDSNLPERGKQFKAPDHFLFDRRYLVERKTLTPKPHALLDRVNTITKEQGEHYVILGQVGLNSIFQDLKDTNAARRRFEQMSVNQAEKCIIDSRDKFREHAAATGVSAASRIVVISEEGDSIVCDGKLMEYYMGSLFLRRSKSRDKVGLIDSIIYIRDPANTIDYDGGHWFKWVTHKTITAEQRRDITWLGNSIFAALTIHFGKMGRDLGRFNNAAELLA